MAEQEKNELAGAILVLHLNYLKKLKDIANCDRGYEKIRKIIEVEGAIDTILNFLPEV